jgi:hypothetical protein
MSENTAAPGDPAGDGKDFGELLDMLGIEPNERVSICSQKPGGNFEHATPHDRADAERLALSRPYANRDVWFSVNPVELPAGYHGRGADQHVTRCAALFADIDIKSGGVSDAQLAETVTKEIASALRQDPVAVVFSGHGGHPYWTLDPEDDAWKLDTDAKQAAAQAVYRRFHRLCADVASRFGGNVDNVCQLSRILRVPGTYNRKNSADPVLVALTAYPFGNAGPLSFVEVAEALDAYGVPELAEDRERIGAVVSEPSEWKFGDQTSPYIAAMVAGWPTDRPSSRHGWLVSQATRLACAHRLTQITQDDYHSATNTLAVAFGELLSTHGAKREPTPGELAGALAWGTQRAAAVSDERAADEVGGKLGDGDRAPQGDELASGVTYPESFWLSRDRLNHIRIVALARRAAPDATLAAVLAQISACIPPSVRVETGIMSPIPHHLFVAPVSKSGRGKSSSVDAAGAAVKIERSWSTDPLADVDHSPVMLPVGEPFPRVGKMRTGEGIAEMFYGTVKLPPQDGKGRPRFIRKQVRSNVLLHTDEGHSVVKFITDPKSIVGETLREAFSGQPIGQSNADESKYRFVPSGMYTLAVIVGFQVSVLADLLTGDELSKGTPQRFLFAWAKTDAGSVTREMLRELVDPGPLTVAIPTRGLRLCEALRVKVDEARIAEWLRPDDADAEIPEIESQRVAMVARIAGLLAILDGRDEVDDEDKLVVNESDWALAETMFATSCAIADLAIADRRTRASKAKQTARARTLAESIEDEEARGTPEGRATARILGYLTGLGQVRWTGKAGIRAQKFNSKYHEYADAALAQLVESGRLRKTEVGQATFVELLT